MIRNEEQRRIAERCIAKLERVLRAAQEVHPPGDFRATAEPIVLDLQRRHEELLHLLLSRRAQESRDDQIREFQQRIAERIESLERGEFVDGEETMARLISELDDRQQQH